MDPIFIQETYRFKLKFCASEGKKSEGQDTQNLYGILKYFVLLDKINTDGIGYSQKLREKEHEK